MSKKTSIIFALFVIGLGVLNHFIYSWFPYPFVGLFAPVNESIFEHLKLVFYPFLLSCIIRYFIVEDDYYFLKSALSSIVGILTIPLLYYLINIFVTPPAFINILIFLIACVLQELTFYKLMNDKTLNVPVRNSAGIIVIVTIILAFSVFTFNPPKMELFKDPETNSYGINS